MEHIDFFLSIKSILMVVSAILSLLLGLTFLIGNVKNRANGIYFFILGISVSTWSIGHTLFEILPITNFYIPFIARLLYVSAALIPTSLLLFAYSLRQDNKKRLTNGYVLTQIVLSLCFIGISALILFSNSIIEGVFFGEGIKKIAFGKDQFIYVLYIAGIFSTAFFLLLQKYVRSRGDEKQKARLILTGTGSSAIVATTSNLFLPFLGIFDYFWLGPAISLAMVIVIGYAIMRHDLLGFKSVLAQSYAYLIPILGLFGLFYARSVTELIVAIMIMIVLSILSIMLLKKIFKETELRRKNEELSENLKKANERLRNLDQLKTEFLSIATHQLRTPLTAIKGYTSLILEGAYGKAPNEMQKILDNIFKSSSLMAETITDFMNVSRIELGHIEYNKSDFECSQLINEVVSELQPRAKEAGLALNMKHECGDNQSPILNGDYGKVKYIFSNLVENAIKYTPHGSVTVSGKINLDRHTVLVTIQDTGIGISKDEIDDLFSKFKRARNAHNINIQGTGLGLFVAREMVKAHGGNIWVESDGEGKGSRFLVELPYVRIEDKLKAK